jgi:hypothetical protein
MDGLILFKAAKSELTCKQIISINNIAKELLGFIDVENINNYEVIFNEKILKRFMVEDTSINTLSQSDAFSFTEGSGCMSLLFAINTLKQNYNQNNRRA